MSNLIYKVRNKVTGKFSTGGISPSFTNKGKSWSSIGPLKTHLRQISSRNYFNDCEVVEYQMVENATTPLNQFYSKEQQKLVSLKKKKQDLQRSIKWSQKYQQHQVDEMYERMNKIDSEIHHLEALVS